MMLDWFLVGWLAGNVAGATLLAALTSADYAWLIPLTVSSVAQGVVLIINAIRTNQIHKQVNLPSSDRTLGEAIEGVVVSSHAAAIDSARVRKEVLPNAPPPLPLPEQKS